MGFKMLRSEAEERKMTLSVTTMWSVPGPRKEGVCVMQVEPA